LGTLGNENFGGTLESKTIVLWRNPLVQEEEDTWVVCSIMLLLELMLGTQQQQQQVLTSRSFVTRLVCHILRGGGYLISEDLAFVLKWCDQQIVVGLLLVVEGKKSLS
jgi:hypothetical protein